MYDRQELGDLVRALQEGGFVKGRCGPWIERGESGNGYLGVLDEQEEKEVFWFVGEKHWYQVAL